MERHWRVPRVRSGWRWEEIPALSPLVLVDGSGAPEQATTVRLAWDEEALHVRFDCADRDAWGTHERRDDPLYEEEAVEVFLAPEAPEAPQAPEAAGEEGPRVYFEFEVSPRGVLFDARVHNPRSRRSDMRTEVEWDCPGIRWQAGRHAEREDWWAVLAIPWAGIGGRAGRWRANFYRIERPRDGAPPEFSAWSPTLTTPADFHKPARFGVLELG